MQTSPGCFDAARYVWSKGTEYKNYFTAVRRNSSENSKHGKGLIFQLWELLITTFRGRIRDRGRGLAQPLSCVCATLFTSLPTPLPFLAYSFPWSPTDVNFGEPRPVPQTLNLSHSF